MTTDAGSTTTSTATRRPYRSPLRQEQAKRTRTVVLEALLELVHERGVEGLSVREVAERAGVSERTVYRYFPDRAALLDGLADWLDERLGSRSIADGMRSVDDLAVTVPRVFDGFEEHEVEARAMIVLADALRTTTTSHDRRTEEFRELFAGLEGVTPRERDQLLAIVRLLISSRSWLVLRDEFGVDGSTSGALVAWAVRTLLAEARANGVDV